MKKFASGLLAGIILSASISAFASTQSVEVFFNDIKLIVNGQTINTGEDKPFIYNGRTYMPVKYVAEALGASTAWNETDNAVIVTSGKMASAIDLQSQIVSEEQSVEKKFYKLESPSLILGTDGDYCITRDNEKYLPIAVFGKYYSSNDDAYILAINDTQKLIIPKDSMDTNADVIKENVTFIKLSALGLTGTIEGDTLTIQ